MQKQHTRRRKKERERATHDRTFRSIPSSSQWISCSRPSPDAVRSWLLHVLSPRADVDFVVVVLFFLGDAVVVVADPRNDAVCIKESRLSNAIAMIVPHVPQNQVRNSHERSSGVRLSNGIWDVHHSHVASTLDVGFTTDRSFRSGWSRLPGGYPCRCFWVWVVKGSSGSNVEIVVQRVVLDAVRQHRPTLVGVDEIWVRACRPQHSLPQG